METYCSRSNYKRKFVVPLLVLLLCGVALTGTAYAYNSTLNGTGDAPVSAFEISLGSSANVTSTTTNTPIEFNSVVDSAKTVYTVADNQTITFKVYLLNEKNTATTEPSVWLSVTALTVTNATGVNLSVADQTYDSTEKAWTVTLNVSGSVTVAKTSAGLNTPLQYTMTLTAGSVASVPAS